MSMNNAHVAVCALLFVCFFWEGGGGEEVVNQSIVEKTTASVQMWQC